MPLFALRAQVVKEYSDFCAYYRITPQEAKQFYLKENSFDTTWLHTFVGTDDTLRVQNLPPGHYLRALARQEYISVEMHTVYPINVLPLATKRGLAFTVTDTAGWPVKDVVAKINGKNVHFDPKMQCFLKKKWYKEGRLIVEALGNMWFYEIEKQDSYGISIRQQRIALRMTKPLGRLLVRSGITARSVRQRRYSDERWYNFVHRRENKLNARRSFNGYIAFSQPQYRPGDTLKVKAWLETRKGQTWKKPVQLEIRDTKTGKFIRKIPLAPTAPGRFEYTLPITDSLLIDRNYACRFSEQKPPVKGIFRRYRLQPMYKLQQVYLEDYVLDEITYTFTSAKTTYLRDDSVVFHLKARDGNNQPIPDGRYVLTVTNSSISRYDAPEMLVPDTIWRTEGVLPMSGDLDIYLPRQLIPPAKMSLLANINCYNSAGELQTKNLSVTVGDTLPDVAFSIKKGWLYINWQNKNSPPPVVSLVEVKPQSEDIVTSIQLPFRKKLDASLYEYDVVLDKKKWGFEFDAHHPLEQPGITLAGTQVGDSVLFILENPHLQPVRYMIYRDGNLFEEGVAEDSLWIKKISNAAGNNYLMKYTYLWGGDPMEGASEVKYFDKLLKVNVEQPLAVVPGESVQVKVKVTDQHNKPVKSADLTSGSVNTLFGDKLPYSNPQIRGLRRPDPLAYEDFSIEEATEPTATLPLSEKWYSLFQLDKNPYYQIRHLDKNGQPPVKVVAIPVSPNAFLDEYGRPATFPDQGYGLPGIPAVKDSFYLKKPQFAPFIIDNYKSQPVYMIWLNERLVYYYGTSDQQPYSFFGEPGKNNIRIRTLDGEFVIDSVDFKAGTKYLISLSETYFKQNATVKSQPIGSFEPQQAKARIRYSPMAKNQLNSFEKRYLQQSIFSVQFNNYQHREVYTWASGYDIHRMTDNRLTYLIGPFPTRFILNFLQTDGFFTSFEFEPGFDYEISPGRERLYHNKNAWLVEKLPAALPKKSINDWALGPHHIRKTTLPGPQYIFATPDKVQQGKGTLRIAYFRDNPQLKGFALKGERLDGPFVPNNRTWGLKPGRYTLILFANNGKTAQKQVEIRRDTLTYIDLTRIEFGDPLPHERFDSLFRPVDRTLDVKNLRTAPFPIGYSGQYFGGILEGVVKDETGEVLIGASVRLIQSGVFIRGAISDIEGRYQITGVPPGVYTVEISYTGYGVEKEEGVMVREHLINYLDMSMQSAEMLQEVVVTGYGLTRRISQDAISYAQWGNASYAAELQDLKSYSLNGKVFGANISYRLKDELAYDHDKDIPDSTQVFIDLPQSEASGATALPRSNFKDHAFFQTNLSTDENGEAFFTATYPDNITGWKTYALAAGGNGRFGLGNTFTRSFKPLTAQLAVPRFAVAGDRFDVAGRVSNYTDDSIRLETRFRLNRQEIAGKSVRIGPGWSETTTIETPGNGTDSLSVEYEALSGKNTDGEIRAIPVVPVGSMETAGEFFLLEGDTTVQFSPEPAHGPVTFYAQNNVLDLLLSDVEYLYNYPYGCNEQTASRLTGLLSLKKIKAAQGQPFRHEKDIYACLKRLKNNQSADGSWGWWQNGQANIWMTIYAAEALQKARDAGYEAAGLSEALSRIRLQLPAMAFRDQQAALTLLRNTPVNIDCKPFVTTLDSMERRWRDHSLGYKLQYWRLRQLCGDKVERDSLLRYLQTTTFGGMYCGRETTHWYDRRAMLTLLAYDIAQNAGWADITAGIRRYWLETRKERRNTLETAEILERMLPEILKNPAAAKPASLTIGQMRYDTFPVRVELAAARNQPLTISKSGGSVVFANTYQRWHNPDPQPRSDIFEVKSRLINAEGQTVTSLKFGEAATLEVTVKVKSAAEYVMIEAPIPAGCGYGTKIQPWGPEVHREYFRDKTAIFCESMPVGDYTFRIPLEARFTGTFTLNPAKVEQMYFPVFFGRNGVENVQVK